MSEITQPQSSGPPGTGASDDDRSNPSRPGMIALPPEQGRREGTALCLSGGGFRASLFHLGALRRLHEAGILQRVRTISSVSGGSILAGYLAGLMIKMGITQGPMRFYDWETDVAQGFRTIAGRDLRTWPVLAHILWNWAFPGPRVRHMVRRYENRVTPRLIGELPASPEFIFCATDMVFGANWEFSRVRCGDWLTGYTHECGDWPIAMAVAASACFPPLFGPMPLKVSGAGLNHGGYRGADRDQLCRNLSLSDGGVYDNMALEPAWKEHEYVLVSDCGAPFQSQIAGDYLSRLMRYTSVIMNQAAAMRKRAFFSDISEKQPQPCRRYKGAYWGIAGSVQRYKSPGDTLTGYSPELVDEVIDRVRTDLDRFTMAEMCVLENHGYLVASAVLSCRRPELIAPGSPPAQPPHPEWMDEARVRREMRDSHKRFSLRRLLGR